MLMGATTMDVAKCHATNNDVIDISVPMACSL